MYLQLVSFLSVIVLVWSACHTVPRKAINGEDDGHCVHPEFPDYRLTVGSYILTQDCLNISCFDSGVYVCQFGWALAGVIGLPDDCKKAKVGDCGVKFVKADDEDQLCFKDASLEFNSI